MTDQSVQRVVSTAHADRLAIVEDWIVREAASGPIRIIAPTQRAADDIARRAARRGPGLVGIHRTTLARLATAWSTPILATAGRTRLSSLAAEALAVRSVHRVTARAPFEYFGPVQHFAGFPRAAARTILELRQAEIETSGWATIDGPRARDLQRLLSAFEDELTRLGLADRALVLSAATDAARSPPTPRMPAVLVDVVAALASERRWYDAVVAHGPKALIVGPALESGDSLDRQPELAENEGNLGAARRMIFSTEPGPKREPDGQVQFFSAPGEARECVEIARQILAEAAAGRRFDDLAILLPQPEVYHPLVEDALHRAGIPMFATTKARRPRPSGRAVLALLACASENLSARRFAEYLSLGQVPLLDESAEPPLNPVPWVPPKDERQLGFATVPPDPDLSPVAASPETDDSPAPAGHLLTPLKWERLLVDAEVRTGGTDRWRRRLEGYEAELRLQLRRMADGRENLRAQKQGDLRSLRYLIRFALPVVSSLEALPRRARWGQWLAALRELVGRSIRDPEPVLAVLAELAPMTEVGPVDLDEVRQVLHPRLSFLQEEPAGHRFGRVFVAPIEDAAGRAFSVVFLPGLAQGIFPRTIYEDPLLPDRERALLDPELPVAPRRRSDERRRLVTALGAATERLVASYPRVDLVNGRPRVPSFYAFDLLRAAHGRLPSKATLEATAAAALGAEWGWPAPAQAERAIDDGEYDLAVLGPYLLAPADEVRGRGRYLIDDGRGQPRNAFLVRALFAEARRWRSSWSSADGLVAEDAETRAVLAAHHPTRRAYSATALQHYADCPYRFALQAIFRLRPRDPVAPIEDLDPLTRGALFHEVQFHFLQRLRRDGRPLSAERRAELRGWLEAEHTKIAAVYRDRLAPAVAAVWNKAMDHMRIDLHGWLDRLASESADAAGSAGSAGWHPRNAELAFGLADREPEDHDPDSIDDPVTVLGRYRLRGAIDLVEHHVPSGALRVTDHKTGRAIDRSLVHIGGGRHLQPVLYALAAEGMLGAPVGAGRLSYCTRRGGYAVRDVVVDDEARAAVESVYQTLEGAFERGTFFAAPTAGACRWCDYRRVCGPFEEQRWIGKDLEAVADLEALRARP